MSDTTEVDHLLHLLVEGREIVTFYENEVRELQSILALLMWDYSEEEWFDGIRVDIANALGRSLKRVAAFDES